MRLVAAWALVCVVVPLGSCSPSGGAPDVERIVLLPDTQCYARYAPEVLEAQAHFIARQRRALNIVHVAHLGDITDTGAPEEWEAARYALERLFGRVSLTLVTGNHDLGENGSASSRSSRIDATFAPAELLVDGTYDGSVQNSYTLVGERLLVLGLEFAPRAAVVAWADGVLQAHRDRAAIVVTHAFLGPDGQRYDRTGPSLQAFSPYEYGVATDGDIHDGEELWDSLVALHDNVRMVVSGHVPQGFEVLLSPTDGGREVVQLMADYQLGTACDPNGTDGDGYLLLLELPTDPAGTVHVRSYSPYLNRWRDDHTASFAAWAPPDAAPP